MRSDTAKKAHQAITFFYNLYSSLRKPLSLPAMLAVLMMSGCGGGLGSSDEQEADPVVQDLAVVYVKRPLLFDDNGNPEQLDVRRPAEFRPGAVLYIKDRATASASERDISSQAFSGAEFLNDEGQLLYDVKDLSVSTDGEQLVFAMRAPEIEDADEDEQPTWNIWIYEVESESLRRVITSDTRAEVGDDIAPHFLSDGRIAFSSTRQHTARTILLDENKQAFSGLDEDRREEAFTLHVMEADGSGIEQITFNQSHDLDPIQTRDGKIVFSRWDNAGGTQEGIHLYRVNPDGSELELLYGRHSHDTGPEGSTIQYLKPQESESGSLLVQLKAFVTDQDAGVPTLIDVNSFIENDISIDGSSGTAQSDLITNLETDGSPSVEGLYDEIFPLYDGTNRYLISWSICRLLLQSEVDAVGRDQATIERCTQARIDSGNYIAADPIYGLWVWDVGSNSRLPLVTPVEGVQYDEAVIMVSRPSADFIRPVAPTGELDILADQGYGVLDIRSVYDFDGVDTTPAGISAMRDPVQTSPDQRPARFVRIEKAVAIPDDTVRDIANTAYGRSTQQLMREVLGYSMVEPDGSVRVAVPAQVPLAISVLDENGRRVGGRHQNWLQVQPGEVRSCNGCHTANSREPHGRIGVEPESVNAGAATSGIPFPNSVTSLVPQMGETMAQTAARVNGTPVLTPDVVYEDIWTNPVLTPADPFTYSYNALTTDAPISATCETSWNSFCRIIINYETHIHPLWSVDRQVFDNAMVLQRDDTCISCHTGVDAMDMAQVPEAQLDLTDGPSDAEPDHLKSYRELLFTDLEQVVDGGVLIDRTVETDTGNVDENGNPIIVIETFPVTPSLSVNGAQASSRFLSLFDDGGTHAGRLSADELRLISEWLDIGAQYYNNPFDAPED